MPDPYMVLGIPENAAPEIIRQAYLEGIRAFPPEQAPQRFRTIAAAYEEVKHDIDRARRRVFGAPELPRMRRLADLVPAENKTRQRIGMDAWLDANTEAP